MKLFTFICTFFIFGLGFTTNQQKNPWQENQLMQPETLAKKITQNQLKNTLILSVGFDAAIKNSVDIGAAGSTEGVEHLKTYLKNIKKDKEIVIYCGCCPFYRCPNIRPAFKTLQEMGFKNAKLLNLTTNIKTDWLDKGFPTDD